MARHAAIQGDAQSAGRGSLRARLLRGSAWSVVFQLVSKSSLFLVGALVARQLPVRDFGLFISVQGALILAAAIADRGISLSVEREAAISAISQPMLSKLMRFRSLESVGLAGLTFCILMGVTPALGIKANLFLSLASGAVYAGYLSNSYLQSQQRFRASALIQSSGRLTYLILVLLVFDLRPSVFTAALCWFISEAFTSTLQAVLFVRRSRADVGNKPELDSVRLVIRRALPYWVAMVAFLAYNRADSALCALFSTKLQAGYYAPASNLQTALMVIPGALTASLAVIGASSIKAGMSSSGELLHEVSRLVRLGVAVSFAASCIVFATAPQIIDLFVGPRFGPSVWPTRILACSLPFNAVQGALVGVLVALGQPRRTVYFYLTCFSVSIALNAILTPRLGADGAAVAALMRDPIGLAVLWVLARRSLKKLVDDGPFTTSQGATI